MRSALAGLVAGLISSGSTLAEEGTRRAAPAVALLVADQGEDDATSVPRWASVRGKAAASRVGDRALAAAWGDGAIRLVDVVPRTRQIAKMGVGAAGLSPTRARELSRLLGADVVVHGIVVTTNEADAYGMLERSSGMKPSSTGYACVAALTLQAYSGDTGEVLAEAGASARSTERNPSECEKHATTKAVQVVAADLRERILASWRAR